MQRQKQCRQSGGGGGGGQRPRLKLLIGETVCAFVYTYLAQCSLTSFELLGSQNDALTRQLCTIAANGLAYFLALHLASSLNHRHASISKYGLASVQVALNPAIGFAYAVFGLVNWTSLPLLVAGHYLGAFLAAPFIHATFSDKLSQRHEDGQLNVAPNEPFKAYGNALSTGKFFASFPAAEVSITQLTISYALAACFFGLLTATAMLDPETDGTASSTSAPSQPTSANVDDECLVPLQQQQQQRHKKSGKDNSKIALVAAGSVLIHAAFCANGGPVVNPAMDLAPRIYLSLFGWGASAFSLHRNNYWWFCCVFGPHVGACVGLVLYQATLFVKYQPTAANSAQQQQQQQQQHPQPQPQRHHPTNAQFYYQTQEPSQSPASKNHYTQIYQPPLPQPPPPALTQQNLRQNQPRQGQR